MPEMYADGSGLPNQSPRRRPGGWVLPFVGALILYVLTASRGVQWQDSGDRILRIYLGEILTPFGLALTHPLHYWLGRLAVLSTSLEPAFAITLVSALAAALAVANVYGCVWTATRCLPAAFFAAVSLAVANTFWQLATITETYTLTAALLAAECWCLLAFARGAGRYALWGMLLFNGLGVANHLQAGLTTPVLLVVAVLAWRGRRVSLSDLIVGAALWILGTLPYSGLVVVEMARSGDLAGTLKSALVGKYGTSVFNVRSLPKLVAVCLAFLAFSFPNLLLPAAGYGVAKARQIGIPAMARRALLAGLILHALFVIRYDVQDQHTFLLPVMVLLCIFGGIGAAAVWRWNSPARRVVAAVGVALLIATPLFYWGTVSLLRHYGVFRQALYRKHHKPYRDNYQYLLIPWSVIENSADRMSREAVRLAGDYGLIVSEDSMAQFAIKYQALRTGGRGVEMTSWTADSEAQAAVLERAKAKAAVGAPVVLVPLDRDRPVMPPPCGAWERKGDLYVLSPGGIPASMDAIPQ